MINSPGRWYPEENMTSAKRECKILFRQEIARVKVNFHANPTVTTPICSGRAEFCVISRAAGCSISSGVHINQYWWRPNSGVTLWGRRALWFIVRPAPTRARPPSLPPRRPDHLALASFKSTKNRFGLPLFAPSRFIHFMGNYPGTIFVINDAGARPGSRLGSGFVLLLRRWCIYVEPNKIGMCNEKIRHFWRIWNSNRLIYTQNDHEVSYFEYEVLIILLEQQFSNCSEIGKDVSQIYHVCPSLQFFEFFVFQIHPEQSEFLN